MTAKGDPDSNDFTQSANKHLISQIKRLCEQPEYLQKEEILVKLASTKYKEVLREVLAENNRKGNFIRIYPSQGSDFYDQFFEKPRPYNRYVYKMLYSDYFDSSDTGTVPPTNEPTIEDE